MFKLPFTFVHKKIYFFFFFLNRCYIKDNDSYLAYKATKVRECDISLNIIHVHLTGLASHTTTDPFFFQTRDSFSIYSDERRRGPFQSQKSWLASKHQFLLLLH